MATIEVLIKQAKTLSAIPLKTATAYQAAIPDMTAYVDKVMSERSDIQALIGQNPLQAMYDNHINHARFMASVFTINSFSLLAKTLPWVYRVYHNQNFSYDYFLYELNAWQEAMDKFLAPEACSRISAIYQWMTGQHELVIQLSELESFCTLQISEDWLETKNSFLQAVLSGDHNRCLQISRETVNSSSDIESFYLQVLQPVLYEIGTLWEQGKVSVAVEHLASAIIRRVMVSVNLQISPAQEYHGKVVVAAAPNEYHEIGASMVADLLEILGWQVSFLGANVPETDLIAHLEENNPDILMLSVTIPFNLPKAERIIRRVKKNDQLKDVYLIVGGIAFNEAPEIWQKFGADAFARSLDDIEMILDNWSAGHH